MPTQNKIYSVYVSDACIELRSSQTEDSAMGRLICSQTNYRNILKFASNLAKYKKIPLNNYATDFG